MSNSARSCLFWLKVCAICAALTVAVVVLVTFNQEIRTSALQARLFARLAGEAQFMIAQGPNDAMRFPQAGKSGPYDERLGYTQLPWMIAALKEHGFEVTRQARLSPRMIQLADAGLYAPYTEKNQAGLAIFDHLQKPIFWDRYPERIFNEFDDVPPILVKALLFIENKELLDERYPTRDPAVEWDRLAKAMLDQSFHAIAKTKRAPGGSTLATQIEKYRHSPDGRTLSFKDKLRQMLSAALRAYRQGENTSQARHQIVLDYINTMPLSARTGFGEINGLGDGLWAWYGQDFDQIMRDLRKVAPDSELSGENAQELKRAISLLIAQRRPTFLLGAHHEALDELTNSYLRLMANAGILSVRQRDQLLGLGLNFSNATRTVSLDMNARKSADSVRHHVASLLGSVPYYQLDRFDLEVSSTLDHDVQSAVNQVLRRLRDPEYATRMGFHEYQLLERGDTDKVVYSFTLFERGERANYLRVQTDNFDQPLNINEGTKLDLGSTAKLRTLVTYLDLIAQLHQRYSVLTPDELAMVEVDPQDTIGRWALDYLKSATARDLTTMLNAALERSYSANPREEFFTGGGVHKFDNFRHEDDGRVMTVREGLRNSVNLVFIRIMRDLAHHYMFQVPGSSAKLLKDVDNGERRVYLQKFADHEGRQFLQRFYAKYHGHDLSSMEEGLLQGTERTPSHIAVIHRALHPDADIDDLARFLDEHMQHPEHIDSNRLKKLYSQYAPTRLPLIDRAFVASVHPLELWVASYLAQHPEAHLTDVYDGSRNERQQVYQWLFSAKRKAAQDKRILTMLEQEGFSEILQQWKRVGYAFDSIVPSYATALGASADRPAALAELMGILVNDGLRKPIERINTLRFAAGTPYETEMTPGKYRQQQVLAPEVAQAVRGVLRLVVQEGTARRVSHAFKRPDGSEIEVGGKTGTGDHRFETLDAHGNRVESRVVERTATFVFNIDQRFFGTITAYVPGEQAAQYKFTSALPVQILKVLAPTLRPLWEPEISRYASKGGCSGEHDCVALR